MHAVIVDTQTYADNLPASLLAIFVLDFSDGEAINHAREVHAGYLREYPHIDPAQVPLVRLSLRNTVRPFTVIPNGNFSW